MVKVKFNLVDYIVNDYMHGTCPGCQQWEAPITLDELVLLPDRLKVHRGSSERKKDPHVLYTRETWREFFECPHCQTHFAVPFSST